MPGQISRHFTRLGPTNTGIFNLVQNRDTNESINISKKLTSQEDRRKFRQGIRCNIEFLNQLNMHDLIKNSLNGKRDISSLHKTITAKLGDIFKCLDEIPVIDLLYLINKKTAQKICSSIDKIVALAHVSQSMGDYFARDDSLDPALSIVCQGLRGNINFEQILRLRGGTFQSLAAAYWHLKSEVDHDLTGRIHASTGGATGDVAPIEIKIAHPRKRKMSAGISSAAANAQGGIVGSSTSVKDVVVRITASGNVDQNKRQHKGTIRRDVLSI